ncbi:MAG TPA: CRTAC1 family protein, partial [Planctomycetia bacterium]|nr:CRTAC1 family protein [Planctomycetia bacterium]
MQLAVRFRLLGVALRRSLVVIAIAGVAGIGWFWFNRKPQVVEQAKEVDRPKADLREKSTAALPTLNFVEIAKSSGIDFVHRNGARGKKLLPETMGGSGGFFDYDYDGDQDLLLVGGCAWPGDNQAGPAPSSLALYRNDGGKFTDVTKAAGLDVVLYGMGCAFGDFDNDGRPDVFISAVGLDPKASAGANRLYRNLGNGKFADVTAAAGVAGRPGGWSTACGFFDFDNDGLLDLGVFSYVDWNREFDAAQPFTLVGDVRAYGRPQDFGGAFPHLYRNLGNGKFVDVAAKAGLQVRNVATGMPMGKSLGLVPVDLDRDGWIDLVVANDTVQNFVFHNQRNGTFKEIGGDSQIAFDSNGQARGAMGIDAAYFRNDGVLGVGIGNFANEPTALYVSQPSSSLLFRDAAISTGVGPPSRIFLKFGLFFFDADLDGRLDLLEANGHLEPDISRVQASQTFAQPAQLFWNAGPGAASEFVEMPPENVGSDLRHPIVGRGAAFADIDGDGDLDVLLAACGGPCRLLRNDQKSGNHWIRLKLVGKGKSNRDAIGALIEVKVGDQTLRRPVMPTRSYLSQVELPVTVGLGKTSQAPPVRIIWPDGSIQDVADVPVDKPVTIEQKT